MKTKAVNARWFLNLAVILGLFLGALVAGVSPARATPTDLFFSEYIEGSSNNKALEIYNGTGGAINLSAGSYNVQMFFNGSSTAGLTINLTGTVANGDVFVLAHSSANATILAQADQTNGSGWYNGNDAVVLRKGNTILDVIGQIGYNPGTEWGSGLTSTADNTLRRKAYIDAGDPVGTDVFDPALQWDGFATDTFSGLGSHTLVSNQLTISDFSANEGEAGTISFDFLVSLSFPAGPGGVIFNIATANGTATAADNDYVGNSLTAQTIPAGSSSYTFSVLVNGDSALELDETFFVNVTNLTGAGISDGQGKGTIINDDPNSYGLTYTPIYDIQGMGDITPLSGESVTTQGVVVGDYEGASPNLRGFYLQDVTGDGDSATSDGIFVFNGNNDNVDLGDIVRVTGRAEEFQGQTQVSAVSSIVDWGTGSMTPVDVNFPVPSTTYLEQFEGMLVRLPQTMYVTEHFQLGRFGQVVMSADGRLQQPTNVVPPGPPAIALQASNNLNRIIIDDAVNNQNPDPILFGRGGNPLSASNTLRGGDTVTGMVGVMTYTWSGNSASGNAYRVRPINALDGGVPNFEPSNPRPSSAPDVGSSLRVVGMNLLNYFNTFDGLPDTKDNCSLGAGGAPTDCRGADTQPEFDRQWPKTVAAILKLNPDVLGVNEIENDGYGADSALQDLVNKLNNATAPGTYAFIDVDANTSQVNAMGTDAIKVALIYKPAMVTPVGQTAPLNSVAFVNGGDGTARNRPSIAQAFQVNANGAVFIVDVNHLKSKGSACDATDAGDGQGNCNIVRVNAVSELLSWLATDPTGTGDPDILLIGDYNSYAMEDPITTIKNAGFTNLVEAFLGPDAYSYVFDGQWGYLDNALGSASVVPQVAGVGDYHINADEPSVLDYNTDFKSAGQIGSLYAPDEFRVSDHDPVIIGLNPDGPPAVSADPSSQTIQYSDPAAVTITASDSSVDLPLLTISTEWKVDGGSFTGGLPAWLALGAPSCDSSSCAWTLSGIALTAPGTYVVRATVSDPDDGSAEVEVTFVVAQEDARATYTGALFASTASPTSTNADVTLAATVQDISVTLDANGDVDPGDIRNATLTFVDRENGNATLCTAVVGLVDPADLQTGTGTCTWTVDLGNVDSITARVGMVVEGYYLRNSASEDAVVTVSKALASQFITGGGYIVLEDSAGQLAGDDGSRANFGFNVKYNKGGRNLQGKVTLIIRHTDADGLLHVYQIKSNAITSLSVQADAGTAVFNGKASIQDVTDPDNPISIAGNAILQISMDDNGEPGAEDTLGITVWKGNGGLWFASKWDGTQTVQQPLDGGNLIVR